MKSDIEFRVYEEKRAEEKLREVFFRLQVNDYDNSIELLAVDKNGERLSQGNILAISKKGIVRHTSVSKDLGFAVDKEDKIVVRK